jgi:hypothetical protein
MMPEFIPRTMPAITNNLGLKSHRKELAWDSFFSLS